MEKLFAFLRKMVNFTDEELLFLSKFAKEMSFKKNIHILHSGEVCNFIAFVLKGTIRNYTLQECGKQKTIRFTFEGQFVSDYSSFLSRLSTDESIETLEPSKLIFFSRNSIDKCLAYSHNFEKFARLFSEKLYIISYNRLKTFLTGNAEDKYRHLVREHSTLLHRVPHYHIASYIGVAPETLSRIRNKIKAEEKEMAQYLG